jgi:hypothetical protein
MKCRPISALFQLFVPYWNVLPEVPFQIFWWAGVNLSSVTEQEERAERLN